MTFDPTAAGVTGVTLSKDHCVQVPWVHQCMWIQWSIMKNTTYILRTEWVIITYVSFWTQFRRDKNAPISCTLLQLCLFHSPISSVEKSRSCSHLLTFLFTVTFANILLYNCPSPLLHIPLFWPSTTFLFTATANILVCDPPSPMLHYTAVHAYWVSQMMPLPQNPQPSTTYPLHYYC